MKVKEFKFKDIRKISITITKLGLNKEDVEEITNVITGASKEMLTTQEQVETYLINNVSAAERKKLYKEHDGDFEALREYALNHKGVSSSGMFEIILKLFEVVGEKFDVIADFIAYYLEDYEVKDILEFDEDQTIEALQAVFTNAGFLKFFSRILNTK